MREGATTPDGNRSDVKGPVFGADLWLLFVPTGLILTSLRIKRAEWDESFEMGHGPLVVMYPESLSSKLS